MLLTRAASLFEHAVALRSQAYERGLFAIHRVPAQVFSVGALEQTGAGRTSFSILAARLLAAEGRHVAVLCRGTTRLGSTRASDGVERYARASAIGADAALLARRLSAAIAVWAGTDRVDLARRAVAAGADTLVLDDGFQYRQLARDADLVLVRSGLYNQRLMPAGTLREPLTALRRATVVVEVASAGSRPCALQAPAGLEMVPTGLSPWAGAGLLTADADLGPLASLEGVRACVVTSIAQPDRLAATARDLGVNVSRVERREGGGRLRVVSAGDADVVITTEKDLVALDEYEGPPLVAIRVEARLWRGEDLVRHLLGLGRDAREVRGGARSDRVRRREIPASIEPLTA